MFKNNTKIIIPSIFYALFFMAGGSYFAYIGLYYASIKLNNAQIGIISSLGLLVGMLAQPMWGTFSDRSKNKTFIMSIILLISAVLIWLIPLSGSVFWLLLVATALTRFFGSSILPMGDSITLEVAKRENFKFSTVRFIGSAGFATMAAIAGKIYAINIAYIFVMFFILRILACLISFFMPPVAGHNKTEEVEDSFFHLFRDRKLNLYYIYIFLLSVTYGFFNAFHAIYSKKIGIGTELIGLGVMIGSFSQFPFMIFFDWFYKKLGINKILIFSGVIYTLRWFLYFTSLSPVTILFIWALHGMTFIVLYLSLADYVSTNVDKRLRTRGQMMNYIVLLGASAIVGSSAGGFISNTIGLKNTFLVSTIICFISLVGFILVTLFYSEFKKSKTNK